MAEPRSRFHWLIAGAFTPSPSGELRSIAGESLRALMVRAGLRVTAKVDDLLGDGDSRELTVTFDRPRHFRIGDVTKNVAPLTDLMKVAEGLTQPRDPFGLDTAVARVRELVGDGRLTAQLSEISAPAKSAPAAPSTAAKPASGSVDAIFAKAAVRSEVTDPKSRVDALVQAIRGGKGPVTDGDIRRAGAQIIQTTVEATAADLLGTPEVNAIETAWRGLKMVLAELPSGSDLARVDLSTLDVPADAITKAVERAMADDPNERPDAIFVTHRIATVDGIDDLAGVAEANQIPIVVAIDPALHGDELRDEDIVMHEDWAELRGGSAARWLCATTNPVALANEPIGEGVRLVFGSPALAICAMLTARARETGGLGGVIGRSGALVAPAAHQVETRRETITVPTERFGSMRAQTGLAEHGVLALGSEPNSDRIVLAVAPTLTNAEDAVSIGAQVVVGKVVRLAQSVRDRVARGASADDVQRALDEASAQLSGVSLKAGTAGDGVTVEATLETEFAGKNIRFSFELSG